MNSQKSIIRVVALSFGLYLLLVVCVMMFTGCARGSATTVMKQVRGRPAIC
jgi:hypothetical protein